MATSVGISMCPDAGELAVYIDGNEFTFKSEKEWKHFVELFDGVRRAVYEAAFWKQVEQCKPEMEDAA